MAYSRKLRKARANAREGRALADWLNREENHPLLHGVGPMIAAYVIDRHHAAHELERRYVLTGVRNFTLRLTARTRMAGRRIDLAIQGADGESGMLRIFDKLLSNDGASRLRHCRGCGGFWYCEGRSDKTACSAACKVSLWQKTPSGRKKRAAYMRDYRAALKRLWEAKQGERKINRGRKLHVGLKKGQ